MMNMNLRASVLEVKKFLRQCLRDQTVLKCLVTLVTVDILFFIVHVLKAVNKEEFIGAFGYWLYRNLTITNDWAIPEIFNYCKFVVIVYFLYRTFSAIRQPIYLSWVFIYLLAFLDDSLMVHEIVGEYLGSALSSYGIGSTLSSGEHGVRASDLGELIVYALYALACTMALGVGFLRTSPLHRSISMVFFLLLASLTVFAVAFDFIARLFNTHGVVGTLEDTGEMLAISVTVAYAFAVRRRFAPPAG